MSELFPHLLRSVTTDIMLMLLLCTMAIPKYKSKGVYIFVITAILAVNVVANCYFYLTENYTAVFHVDSIMLVVIGIALKPLFADKIMQWCFSYITMINIYVVVVFLSYIFGHNSPSPAYLNAFLRLIMFSFIIVGFRKWVSVLYRNVLDYWHIYMLPIAMVLACFLAYFFGGNIEEMLQKNSMPLMLLVLLDLSVYISIIHSLRAFTKHYAIREENQKIQAEREYLQLASVNMVHRLELMEEVSAQNSRAAHDRRHFNNILLELLEQGANNEATALLKKQNQITHKISKGYCENTAVNAAVSHYAAIAEQFDIKTQIELDIPTEIDVDSLELSMVISNLMENAIQACIKLNKPSYLRFTCCNVGRLLLEIENPCSEYTKLDENNLPRATDEGHGIGSKSVQAFAKKYNGEIIYKIENGIFRVRLLV